MRQAISFLFFLSQVALAQVTSSGPEGDCGFSKFQPLRMAEYIEKGAVAKVAPQYPLAAKANGTTGIVRVRVLVNSQGLVERTCPEYVKEQPRPDRSLVIAAEAAALQWSFSPHFGIEPGPRSHPRLKYVHGVLIFNFVLDEPRRDASKHD